MDLNRENWPNMGSIGAFGIFFQTEKLFWEIRKRHLRDILIFRYKLSLFGFRQKSEKNLFGIATVPKIKITQRKMHFFPQNIVISCLFRPETVQISNLLADWCIVPLSEDIGFYRVLNQKETRIFWEFPWDKWFFSSLGAPLIENDEKSQKIGNYTCRQVVIN